MRRARNNADFTAAVKLLGFVAFEIATTGRALMPPNSICTRRCYRHIWVLAFRACRPFYATIDRHFGKGIGTVHALAPTGFGTPPNVRLDHFGITAPAMRTLGAIDSFQSHRRLTNHSIDQLQIPADCQPHLQSASCSKTKAQASILQPRQ